MAALYAKFATTLLALALSATGVTLAAAQGASPLSTPIAPFGCYA